MSCDTTNGESGELSAKVELYTEERIAEFNEEDTAIGSALEKPNQYFEVSPKQGPGTS